MNRYHYWYSQLYIFALKSDFIGWLNIYIVSLVSVGIIFVINVTVDWESFKPSFTSYEKKNNRNKKEMCPVKLMALNSQAI